MYTTGVEVRRLHVLEVGETAERSTDVRSVDEAMTHAYTIECVVHSRFTQWETRKLCITVLNERKSDVCGGQHLLDGRDCKIGSLFVASDITGVVGTHVIEHPVRMRSEQSSGHRRPRGTGTPSTTGEHLKVNRLTNRVEELLQDWSPATVLIMSYGDRVTDE